MTLDNHINGTSITHQWHLDGLRGTWENWDQETMLSHSHWSLSSEDWRTKCKIDMSSAYFTIKELLQTGFRSSIARQNRTCPKTLPWGTPLGMGTHEEYSLFTKTRCLRPRKKLDNQPTIESFRENLRQAEIITLCDNLSKALEKSVERKRTAPV